MSTQPFGQSPFGAAPAGVAPPPEPVVEEPSRGSRTVVLAVAAGVVALGVLGGAAALVLSGDDPATDEAVVPPAAAVVEPEPSATEPVQTPLPTALVQGRNVFVPLVKPASADGEEAVAVPTAVPTDAATSGAGGLPGATAGPGTSLPLPVPTVTVTESTTLTEYLTDTELVRELREQIADLQARLAGTEDDDTIAALQEQITRLEAELLDAQDVPAYEFDVLVQDVLVPTDPNSDVVFVLADDSEVTGYSEYTVNAALPPEARSFGPQDELTFMSYTPPGPGTPEGVVTFQYVSNVYRVVEGTALGFSSVPTASPTTAPTP